MLEFVTVKPETVEMSDVFVATNPDKLDISASFEDILLAFVTVSPETVAMSVELVDTSPDKFAMSVSLLDIFVVLVETRPDRLDISVSLVLICDCRWPEASLTYVCVAYEDKS